MGLKKFLALCKKALFETFKPINLLYTTRDAVIGTIKMIILFYTYQNNHSLACFMFMFFYLCRKSNERKKSEQIDQFQQKVMDYLNICESIIKEYKKLLERQGE